DIAIVVHHAELGLGEGLHALGPLPAGLEGGFAKDQVADGDDVDLALGKGAGLVRLAQAFLKCLGHLTPPRFWGAAAFYLAPQRLHSNYDASGRFVTPGTTTHRVTAGKPCNKRDAPVV